MNSGAKLTPSIRALAYVYIRQSSLRQVKRTGKPDLQYSWCNAPQPGLGRGER